MYNITIRNDTGEEVYNSEFHFGVFVSSDEEGVGKQVFVSEDELKGVLLEEEVLEIGSQLNSGVRDIFDSLLSMLEAKYKMADDNIIDATDSNLS